MLDLVLRTRSDARLIRGVSTRGAQSLHRACRALAIARERDFVVPEDVREKVFHPFFTTKENGRGFGLGLSICRDILARHGGDIELVPSERGAVFAVRVPVEDGSKG